MLGIVTNPLWSDIFLVQTYEVMDEKVTTFIQLAKIHSKIFMSLNLRMHKLDIAERIRYLSISLHHFIMIRTIFNNQKNIFRSQIRSNYTLDDFHTHLIEALLKEEKSFIFVTEKSLLKDFETLLTGIKGFDILEDKLGIIE